MTRGFSVGRHFLLYWKPSEMASTGLPINHAASEQFGRARAGDTLWIVSAPDNELHLLGPLRISKVLDQEAAEEFFDAPGLLPASFHACVEGENAQIMRPTPLGDIPSKLTFVSKTRPRLNTSGGQPLGPQLQTMRELTTGSALLLQEAWAAGNQTSPRSVLVDTEADGARHVLERLLPDPLSRLQACAVLAASIQVAHLAGPASWSLTSSISKKRIRLNVGPAEAVTIVPDVLCVVINTADFHQRIPPHLLEERRYSLVPVRQAGVRLPFDDNLGTYAKIRKAHESYIQSAAQARTISVWKADCSVGLIRYLEAALHVSIPLPAYLGDITSAKLGPESSDSFEYVASEGSRALKQHFQRERDRRIVRLKIQSVIQATGQLRCEVCGFDYRAHYGELGNAFSEVHHLDPLASSDASRQTRLEDLAIVCANCHRMIHRREPHMSLAHLRLLVWLNRGLAGEESA